MVCEFPRPAACAPQDHFRTCVRPEYTNVFQDRDGIIGVVEFRWGAGRRAAVLHTLPDMSCYEGFLGMASLRAPFMCRWCLPALLVPHGCGRHPATAISKPTNRRVPARGYSLPCTIPTHCCAAPALPLGCRAQAGES